MIAVAQWLRICRSVWRSLIRMLVTFFSNNFHTPIYPAVTVLLEYFEPVIYSCLRFAL